MTAPVTVADGYAALARGDVDVAVPGGVALVWVEGPDAEGFLQGLLSHDVAGLAVGGALTALLLDERGHLRAAMRVHRDAADAFTLVLDPERAAEVADTLERFHFSEDLEILGPEPAATVVVPAAAAAVPEGTRVPGTVPGTLEVVTDDPAGAMAAAGLREVPAEALERLRIERGAVRVGIDTGPLTLVQEVLLQDRAVSFTKGCYLGQETVARAQHRGKVNRILRVLRGTDGAGPAVGAEVLADGRAVGGAGGSVSLPGGGWIALAVLRREVAPGTTVAVAAAGEATVDEVPAA